MFISIPLSLWSNAVFDCILLFIVATVCLHSYMIFLFWKMKSFSVFNSIAIESPGVGSPAKAKLIRSLKTGDHQKKNRIMTQKQAMANSFKYLLPYGDPVGITNQLWLEGAFHHRKINLMLIKITEKQKEPALQEISLMARLLKFSPYLHIGWIGEGILISPQIVLL